MIRKIVLTEEEELAEQEEVRQNWEHHGKPYGMFDDSDRIRYLDSKYGREAFRDFMKKLDREAI